MYCVLNMGWTPSQYINLNEKERAFIIASIQMKLDKEKKPVNKIKHKTPKIRRR